MLIYEAEKVDNQCGQPERENGPPKETGFFELIYGVLFEPGSVFRRIASDPPLKKSVLIFTLVKFLSVVVAGYYSMTSMGTDPYIPAPEWITAGLMQGLVMVVVFFSFIFEYVQWFLFSGLMHLLAGLMGGNGKPSGILTVTALASLPALLLFPVQMAAGIFFAGSQWLVVVWSLTGLVSLCWGVVLVILGISETYALSRGRSLAVVMMPAGVLILLGVALALLITAFMMRLGAFLV